MILIRKIQESVFIKLLFVFVLAATANIVAIHFFQKNFVFDDARRMHRNQNKVQYAQFLAASLGLPPSEKKIQDLSNRLHLQIRVEGVGFSQVSSPQVPEFKTVDSELSLKYSDSNSKVGKFRNFMAIETRSSGARYLFLLESEEVLEGHSEFILILMIILLSILLITYLSIRRILGPLKSLEKGVKEVSQGNLNISISRQSRDELGRLVQSFNQMTEQIRTMVQSKEQLLLGVSHEFRSPLTRIKVAMELSGDDARESIKRSVRELETMIAELLESARLNDAQGKLKLEETNLSFLIKDLVSRYEKEKPGVLFVQSKESISGLVDSTRIHTALKNVVENAMKYSSHQSRPVEISINRCDQQRIRIAIRDFGIGISKDEQALVFEPFYRVDRSRVRVTGGYGLGLSLSKKIISAHQGRIEIQSVPGRETLFSIELPG